jgi:hypothetical protein
LSGDGDGGDFDEGGREDALLRKIEENSTRINSPRKNKEFERRSHFGSGSMLVDVCAVCVLVRLLGYVVQNILSPLF